MDTDFNDLITSLNRLRRRLATVRDAGTFQNLRDDEQTKSVADLKIAIGYVLSAEAQLAGYLAANVGTTSTGNSTT